PRLATYTDAPNVSRPRYSNTMPGSSPTRRRIASPRIRPALGCRNPCSPSSSSLRLMTCSQPCARTISAFSSDDTTATGMPPPVVAVDAVLAARGPDARRLRLGRHDGDGAAPAVLPQLRRERAEPAGRAPDQDDVALLHPGAVRPDQHPVGGAAAQRHRTRLLPGEVRGLADELVRLHDAELAERPEVRLEAPRELRLAHHAVVVGAVVLLVHVRRGQHDLVADLPALHAAAGADDDARAVRPEDVVRQVVPRPVPALAAELLKERERRHRLEDRGPDGVEVDRRRHHGDDDLVGRELGHLDLADVHGAAHVLVGPALEDPDLVLAGERRAEPRRQVDLLQFGTAG